MDRTRTMPKKETGSGGGGDHRSRRHRLMFTGTILKNVFVPSLLGVETSTRCESSGRGGNCIEPSAAG